MPTDFGPLVIAWTARVAVACYLARLAIDAAGRTDDAAQRVARAIWTAGLVIYLLHVAAAFQFQHGWSHAAAWEHVRQQTRSLTGWDTGVGLSVNYGFTLLWLVDCLLWWQSLPWSRRRLSYWFVQGVFAFLVFNATVVFGPRGWLAVGVAAVIVLLSLRWRARRRLRRLGTSLP